jgi:hypothetical protein
MGGVEMEPERTNSPNDKLQDLEEQHRELAKRVEEMRKPQEKDLWDKLGSLTGVIVAIVGGLFSLLYNYHQSKQDDAIKTNQAELQKIQLVGTFMPYLSGADERARTIALFEVQDILNAKAALALAVNVNSAKNAGGSVAPSDAAVAYIHSVAQTGDPADRSAAVQALENICGKERWAVKTLADQEVSQVNFRPVSTTIEELAKLARPSPIPGNDRLESERKTYSVTAKLTTVKLEMDGDYHLILQADTGQTMVAEIPSPSCYSGNNTDIRSQFQTARDAIDAAFLHGERRGLSRITSDAKVEVTGVGFFDFVHGQMGMAPNGFELHPVLSIQLLQQPRP